MATELNQKYPGRVSLLEDRHTVLLTSPTASKTLIVEVGDDAVRVSAGRILHAEAFEGPDDLPHVIEIINAILDGCAEELFGPASTGVFGFIGYRISGARAPVTRLDEDAKIIHTARL